MKRYVVSIRQEVKGIFLALNEEEAIKKCMKVFYNKYKKEELEAIDIKKTKEKFLY